MRPQPAPADLGKAGKALWRGVMREFDPGPSDLALLRQAAAVADHCEQLQAIVSRVDPTIR